MCVLLTNNHMIFLVQFGINQHSEIFQRLQIAIALRARTIWLAFEKFTSADLSQILLEIMRLPILIVFIRVPHTDHNLIWEKIK